MPIIQVWCLPEKNENVLRHIHRQIVRAVTSIPELGIKSELDMTVLFPSDLMQYGLGTDIIIMIFGLFDKPERTEEVRRRLARRVGQAISIQYPEAKVECLLAPPFDSKGAFWTSTAKFREDMSEVVAKLRLLDIDYTVRKVVAKFIMDANINNENGRKDVYHTLAEEVAAGYDRERKFLLYKITENEWRILANGILTNSVEELEAIANKFTLEYVL